MPTPDPPGDPSLAELAKLVELARQYVARYYPPVGRPLDVRISRGPNLHFLNFAVAFAPGVWPPPPVRRAADSPRPASARPDAADAQ